MKTDSQLKADNTSELAWDPSINAATIGVIVKDGVVTPTGNFDSYIEKQAVGQAVCRVAGVRGIALELDVKLSANRKRSDTDIAKAALAALRWRSWVPHERIKVGGGVTLGGDVHSLPEHDATVAAACSTRGVSRVVDRLAVEA